MLRVVGSVETGNARLETVSHPDSLVVPYAPLPAHSEWSGSFKRTKIDGLFEICRPVFKDSERPGYFSERIVMTDLNLVLGYMPFLIQENESGNDEAGVLRGLHVGPWTKITNCQKGSAFVAVADCRLDSPTRGEVFTTDLVEGDGKRLHVPAGCAHGYQALEAGTVYHYLTDERWQPGREKGIAYNSPSLAIPWPIERALLKAADLNNPVFIK